MIQITWFLCFPINELLLDFQTLIWSVIDQMISYWERMWWQRPLMHKPKDTEQNMSHFFDLLLIYSWMFLIGVTHPCLSEVTLQKGLNSKAAAGEVWEQRKSSDATGGELMWSPSLWWLVQSLSELSAGGRRGMVFIVWKEKQRKCFNPPPRTQQGTRPHWLSL